MHSAAPAPPSRLRSVFSSPTGPVQALAVIRPGFPETLFPSHLSWVVTGFVRARARLAWRWALTVVDQGT